jgi:hypothetical protein
VWSFSGETSLKNVEMKSDENAEIESESEDNVTVIELEVNTEIIEENTKKLSENVLERLQLPVVSTQPELNYWKNAKTAFDAKSALQKRYEERHRRRHEERKKVLKNRVAPSSKQPQRSFYFRGIHFNLTNALANKRLVDGTKLFECNDRWCYWCWLGTEFLINKLFRVKNMKIRKRYFLFSSSKLQIRQIAAPITAIFTFYPCWFRCPVAWSSLDHF